MQFLKRDTVVSTSCAANKLTAAGLDYIGGTEAERSNVALVLRLLFYEQRQWKA